MFSLIPLYIAFCSSYPRNFVYSAYRVNIYLSNSEVELFEIQSTSVTKVRGTYLLVY